MEFLDLPPMLGAAGSVRLPGSKSISNRVLLLAALAEGETDIRDLLMSDDVERMLEALRALGVDWRREGDSLDYRVRGVGGPFPVKTGDLFLGNAGTAFRPLTAALALSGGERRRGRAEGAGLSHYRVPRFSHRYAGAIYGAELRGARHRRCDRDDF